MGKQLGIVLWRGYSAANNKMYKWGKIKIYGTHYYWQ